MEFTKGNLPKMPNVNVQYKNVKVVIEETFESIVSL